MKQDDILEAKIINYGMNGEGIAKQDGYVIFVPFAVVGETVKIKITYAKKNFANANLLNVISPSKNRITPPCNRFARCGGCDIMHIQYQEQLKLKKEILKNTLKKNINIDCSVDDCYPSKNIYGYRNKVQVPFGIVNNKVAGGFFQKDSHKIASIRKCFLQGEWFEKLIKIVLIFANHYNISVYDEKKQNGLLRHLVARNIDNQISIVFVINGNSIPHIEILINELQKEFKNFSLYLSENKRKTNVVMGTKLLPIIKNPLIANIYGIRYEINPLSFLQVNNEIRDEIYKKIIEKTKNCDIIIDAYAGIGLPGAIIAKETDKKIYNIEIVPEATQDANVLAKENHLQTKITNINGDTKEELPKLIKQIIATQKFDNAIPKETNDNKFHQKTTEEENKIVKLAIILDPPRKGIDIAVADILNKIEMPINLIYISCNPATLSRDLARLSETYQITSITPFDMFPNTRHLETLVCMTRK